MPDRSARSRTSVQTRRLVSRGDDGSIPARPADVQQSRLFGETHGARVGRAADRLVTNPRDRARRRPPRSQELRDPGQTIYIDRGVPKQRPKTTRRRPVLSGGRKRVLVVLFVPSVERDGVTTIDQPQWVDGALEMFGRVFGGATAYPRAQGIWRDDERGGALVKDEPVVVHCYTTPADIEDSRNLAELGEFCRRMGRDARQGEVGLVVGDEYFAIRDFAKE